MRTAAASFFVFALLAGSAEAQVLGRNQASAQRIPPGQMPPPGQCRVWYDGVPPGRQPRPTNCNEAERIASRDRDARVIYGDDYGNGRYRNGRSGTGRVYEDDRYEQRSGNTVTDAIRDRILRERGSNRYPTNARNSAYNAAYDNGYRDGLEKGREDRGDNDSFDPVRHSRYRSADRGYNSRYGTRDDYKLAYRDGFESGYAQGYGRRR